MKNKIALLRIPMFVGLCAYVLWMERGAPQSAMRIAGAVMVIFGATLWAVASFQLGSSFSVRAKATNLVTTGLYSRIRSPIYVFGTIAIAGFCLLFEKPIWLLFLVVIVPLQIRRTNAEGKALEEKFGDAYWEYKAQTWF
jgi:protein-S-isoprenylcysteine O-methyltransferase Ste14